MIKMRLPLIEGLDWMVCVATKINECLHNQLLAGIMQKNRGTIAKQWRNRSKEVSMKATEDLKKEHEGIELMLQVLQAVADKFR